MSRGPQWLLEGVSWYHAPSGLILPAEGGQERRAYLQLGGTGPDAVWAAIHKMPDGMEHLRAYVDERSLRLPVSTLPALEAAVSGMQFEVVALATSTLAVWIDDLDLDADAQLAVARAVYSDPVLVERMANLLRAEPERHALFALQHVVALQRLAVLRAGPGNLADNDPDRNRLLERVIIGMSAISDTETQRRAAERDGEPTAREFLPMLVQNGAFNTREPLVETLGRVSRIFIEMTADGQTDWRGCDLDGWARGETGLSLAQQIALGFAALASAKALDDFPTEPGTGRLSPTWLADIAQKLGVDVDPVRAMLSAPRDWFAGQFAEQEQALKMDAIEAAAGWNNVPFQTRPFLQLADGNLSLWSPRAIIAWVTDGFYYRAFDQAASRGLIEEFRGYYAALVERYVQELCEQTHRGRHLPGSGRVYRELPYKLGRDKRRTPDVMIDFGDDLVLIEVTSARLTIESRVKGTPERIAGDLKKMVGTKAGQLSRRIDDYLGRHFNVPDVDRAHVKRIWPIIVTGSGLLMGDVLYQSLIEDLGVTALRQARVQPLTVLDLSDFEQLCGLVEAGWSIPQLMSRKSGAHRAFDWRRYVLDDPYLPSDARSSVAERHWEDACDRIASGFGWDIEQMRRDRAERVDQA